MGLVVAVSAGVYDEKRPHDAGNVNAVAMGGKHFLTYYSGNETNTTVYVAPAPLAE